MNARLLIRSCRKCCQFFFGHITVCQQGLGNRIAFIGFGKVVSALILRCKHPLPQLTQCFLVTRILFFKFCLSEIACLHADMRGNASALNHCGTCFFNSGNISGTINAADGCFAVFTQQGNMTALLQNQFHVTGRIACQLGHRCQANGNTNGIHIQFLFCARNRLEMVVYLCNDRTGYTVCSLCLYNGMGQVKRNARSGELCCMDTITANSRSCINNGNHFAASLQQLEADNQTNITRTNHQNLLPRLYALNVHHGLGCTCSNDTRNVPALERNHVFCCTRCNDDGIALIVMDFAVFLHGDFFIFIDAHDGCI